MKIKTFLVIFTIIIIIFIIVYKNLTINITEGNPIFNENVKDSKFHGMYINTYKPIEDQGISFHEVWLERKGAFSRSEKATLYNIFVLKFSFKSKNKLDLYLSDANFKFTGHGYSGDIFGIFILDENILKKDTLKVIFNSNKEIYLKKLN